MNDVDAAALRGFDELPASANVRLPVVTALFSISKATVWRWCRDGHLPHPIRINGVTSWNVGTLRERLAALASRSDAAASAGDTPTESSEPSGDATDPVARPPTCGHDSFP